GIFSCQSDGAFLSLLLSKLRQQAQSEHFGYKEVVLKGDARRLSVHGELREFPAGISIPDFLPAGIAGIPGGNRHSLAIPARRCLVKWLEVRCVCPMCNKPRKQPRAGIGTLLDELL
ncbi:RN122 protein, partial [Hypocryptadius cinnamomeus]|nr:RN122 protein [Hypocryptadius cinnamomeus]